MRRPREEKTTKQGRYVNVAATWTQSGVPVVISGVGGGLQFDSGRSMKKLSVFIEAVMQYYISVDHDKERNWKMQYAERCGFVLFLSFLSQVCALCSR